MNLFRLKRAVVSPYVWYMRRKCRKAPAALIALGEAQYYRPTLRRWILRVAEDPDLLHDAAIDGSSIVLDVGGFTGDWSARIIEKYDPNIYLFEPNPACFPALKERFSGNPKVRCFDYGLHREDATLPLLQAGMGSSVFSDTTAVTVASTIVRLRDIVSALDELGCDSPDLVKLNIEGGEYDVLERLIESDRLSRIRCLMVQFHEWRDGAYRRRRRIRRALMKSHDLDWDYPYIWEKWTRRPDAGRGSP
jgi:FkbM family methyltransferase